jgi:single-strand DNA-binding protein
MSINTNMFVGSGNLTKDPELRETPGGKQVCTLRLAMNRGGERGGTDYINVKVWNGAGEACAKYLSKGSPVLVTGSIRTSEYTKQDGSKGYGFEISAQRVEFLNRRNGEATSVAPSTPEPEFEPQDDDIPF